MSARERAAYVVVIVGAFVLADCLTGCIGYGEFISPAEAQRIEREQCMRKADPEEQRRCLAMVARKYHRYNSEGGYPETFVPPNPR